MGWFFMPDNFELTDNTDLAFYLRVASVKKNSPAEQAGIKPGDQIVGAASSIISEDEKIPSTKLLEQLATISNVRSIRIQYRSLDENGEFQLEYKELMCGEKPFYADYAQRILAYLPKGRTRETKKQAVIFIILMMAVVTTMRCLARFFQDYTVQKLMRTTLVHL
jgi:hypothetical protein